MFAEETLENTFDFAHKLVRMKEPQELPRIQTEFGNRQAQVLAGSGQKIIQDVNDVAKTTLERAVESSGRRSEAHEAVRVPTLIIISRALARGISGPWVPRRSGRIEDARFFHQQAN